MTGAIVAATLLFRVGVSRESTIAVAATLVLLLVSLTLFKWLRVGEPRRTVGDH